MKFPCKTALASALLAVLPLAQAAEGDLFTYSGNVTFASDYVFRGLTQTDEGWAIQGELKVAHNASGVYAKTWASNVNFVEEHDPKNYDANESHDIDPHADIEIDLILGHAGELGNFSYDVNVGYFAYPGADSDSEADMGELAIILGYALPQGTELGLEYDYSPDWSGTKDNPAHNYTLSASHDLGYGMNFGIHVGQQFFTDDVNAKADGLEDYTYYGWAFSFPLGDFEGAINFSDTDYKNGKDSDERVYFTLSKSF